MEMNDTEKIEALRKLFDNIDGHIEELKQGAWWDGFYWTRQKVRDIIDPPKPKWRVAVDKCVKAFPPDPLGDVLMHLSALSAPKADDDTLAWHLANIVAVCEAQVGDGWKADPDDLTANSLPFLIACVADGNWKGLATSSATWLRSLTDGGAS